MLPPEQTYASAKELAADKLIRDNITFQEIDDDNFELLVDHSLRQSDYRFHDYHDNVPLTENISIVCSYVDYILINFHKWTKCPVSDPKIQALAKILGREDILERYQPEHAMAPSL